MLDGNLSFLENLSVVKKIEIKKNKSYFFPSFFGARLKLRKFGPGLRDRKRICEGEVST